MTPSTALVDYQAIARYLGEPYFYDAPWVSMHVPGDDPFTTQGQSDADLCIAVLEKLAREGRYPRLQNPIKSSWRVAVEGPFFSAYAATPILAISALVVALEKP